MTINTIIFRSDFDEFFRYKYEVKKRIYFLILIK